MDARGEIVGMNMRTVVGAYGTPGVSLSLPIEVVLAIAEDCAGGIARPRLGAEFDDVSPQLALASGRGTTQGAVVTTVRRASLAERMGLRPDDVIVAMNDRPIGSSADLARSLLGWRQPAGTKLVIWRGASVLTLRSWIEAQPRCRSACSKRPWQAVQRTAKLRRRGGVRRSARRNRGTGRSGRPQARQRFADRAQLGHVACHLGVVDAVLHSASASSPRSVDSRHPQRDRTRRACVASTSARSLRSRACSSVRTLAGGRAGGIERVDGRHRVLLWVSRALLADPARACLTPSNPTGQRLRTACARTARACAHARAPTRARGSWRAPSS